MDPRTPFGSLLSALERMAGAATIQEVVEVIRSSARRLIGSDGVALVVREKDHVRYIAEDAIGALWEGQAFPIESCVSGWVIQTGETLVIPDIYQHPRVPHDLYRPTFVKSLVMAPLKAAAPTGALGAYWASPYQASKEEIETIESLARATATALENVQLVGALSKALKEAELARDELRHRIQNAFAAAQGLAKLSLPPQYARAFSARLQALARAHKLIDEKLARQSFVAIEEVVSAELAPYRTKNDGRVTATGPALSIASPQAIALGLVLNELATNALKYGALSGSEGKLAVTWTAGDDRVVLRWIESDGPRVEPAASEGLGSSLLRRLIEEQLGGKLSRHLWRHGCEAKVEFPMVTVGKTVPA